MGKENSPQVTRRTTRSLSSSIISSNAIHNTKISHPISPTLSDLVSGEESITLDDLLSAFPARDLQILELLQLLGPLSSPMLPLFIYGGPSTGKTSIVLQIFRHLGRPFIYSSCHICYNSRILFESILNQVLLHRKSSGNGYSSAKRCEKRSDFTNFLREALIDIIKNLKGSELSSRKSVGPAKGTMVYLIFDNFELLREWDKSSNILPFLFSLNDILKMPEVGLIFISNTSLDSYYSYTGFTEPICVSFPDYTEDDLRKIFMRNQENPKLYSSFLDVVLRPFCRITRRVDELSNTLLPLFKKYCEPLSDLELLPNEEMKRRLFSHLQPNIAPSLNEIFHIPSQFANDVQANKVKVKQKSNAWKSRECELFEDTNFHMSTSAKYLLISAFLASRNPATLDASLFDSTGGSDSRRKKRKSSAKSAEQNTAEADMLMKGPGSFPLERLLAIFQCLTTFSDFSFDEKEEENDLLGAEAGGAELMSDVLLQLSSLCNANFICKGGSCPLEGSTRYRSTISEDLAMKVARSIRFPLSKYIYRR